MRTVCTLTSRAAGEEISAPGSDEPLLFSSPSALVWEDGTEARAFTYNLYRGEVGNLGAAGYGACHVSGLEQNGFADETGQPASNQAWFYLVTGANPAGEGPMGQASSGAARANATPCAP